MKITDDERRVTRHRVLFRLTMPNPPSWNGRWSGEGRNYTVVRRLDDKTIRRLGLKPGVLHGWAHHWADGWTAHVEATVLPAGQKVAKSDGFQGYDWMVDSIVRYGQIMDDQARREHLAARKSEKLAEIADGLRKACD